MSHETIISIVITEAQESESVQDLARTISGVQFKSDLPAEVHHATKTVLSRMFGVETDGKTIAAIRALTPEGNMVGGFAAFVVVDGRKSGEGVLLDMSREPILGKPFPVYCRFTFEESDDDGRSFGPTVPGGAA